MPVQYSYRGRVITSEDVVFLRQFIAEHSQLSRRRLSAKVCEAWEWRQANGALRDMVCRGLLLMLHRAGEIQLPEVRFVVGGGEKGRQFGGREGARCGVTLWPAVGAGMERKRLLLL